MAKIEKLKYDENRFKLCTTAVIEEMIAKINEIIDVVNQPKHKGKKEKGKRADMTGEKEDE